MGPFYVQIEHAPPCYNGYYTIQATIILFRDMDIADEWWRIISIDNKFIDLKRTGPCYYVHTHDPSKQWYECAAYSIERSTPSNNLGRVIWPFRDGNGTEHPRPTIPAQGVTDHISGNSFFIRSKADPRYFWHVPRGGRDAETLLVSNTDRTRFRVTVKDAPTPLNGGPVIMIGTDTIEITEARTRRVVGIDSSGYLALGAPSSADGGMMTRLIVEERAKAGEQLVSVEERGEGAAPSVEVTLARNQENYAQIFFNDLKTRFAVVPEDYGASSKPSQRRLEIGDGEEWELV